MTPTHAVGASPTGTRRPTTPDLAGNVQVTAVAYPMALSAYEALCATAEEHPKRW
ncbi:hypothetical protein [Streptomyces sp. CA2R101]|uniref:hypothetical protein n=1 Tax=Streptomyces sp. CA2R101 TaxID=3120152 RepID=UPI0030097861